MVLLLYFGHVGIQGNEKADTLAKEALGLNISNIKIPHTDFRANVNIHFVYHVFVPGQ